MNTGGESNVLERRPIFWFYGSSSIAYGIKDNAFSYLLLTFANQALGVPGYLASLALAIAIVWDALTDPFARPLVRQNTVETRPATPVYVRRSVHSASQFLCAVQSPA